MDGSEIALSGAAAGTATVANFNTLDNEVFTFDIVSPSEGTLTVTIAAGDVADLAGNTNAAVTDTFEFGEYAARASLIATLSTYPGPCGCLMLLFLR